MCLLSALTGSHCYILAGRQDRLKSPTNWILPLWLFPCAYGAHSLNPWSLDLNDEHSLCPRIVMLSCVMSVLVAVMLLSFLFLLFLVNHLISGSIDSNCQKCLSTLWIFKLLARHIAFIFLVAGFWLCTNRIVLKLLWIQQLVKPWPALPSSSLTPMWLQPRTATGPYVVDLLYVFIFGTRIWTQNSGYILNCYTNSCSFHMCVCVCVRYSTVACVVATILLLW